MTKRIEDVLSVEAVKAAYEKTGLEPRRRTWVLATQRCACAAGAVLAGSLGADVAAMKICSADDAADLLGVRASLLDMFTDGFDGDDFHGRDRSKNDRRHPGERMKKFAVWGTTEVHVVRIVEAETAEEALKAFDGAVEVDGNRVKACDERGLARIEISDEWVSCDRGDVLEVVP